MSFLLDTNVISELGKIKRGTAAANVVAWQRGIRPAELFLSVVTLLELEIGALLVERRDAPQGAFLRAWLQTTVLGTFKDRILPLDAAVAVQCARLHVPDRRAERDAWIAATALVHGMTVVTRNVRDFAPTGVRLVNPWEP